MKKSHRCPRCLSMTDEKFYCHPCRDVLKRPPRPISARSNMPIDDFGHYRTVHGRHEDRGRVRG